MKTEAEIVAAIAAAREDFRSTAATDTSAQSYEKHLVVEALLKEQSAMLSHGAEPCPRCKNAPHGRLMTPAHWSRGREVAARYAVQCLACRGERREDGRYVYLIEPMAVGRSPDEAVQNWNDGKWEVRREEKR